MTKEQTGQAMLAILNDRVGVKGSTGAHEFLADCLGCTPEEAADLDEFGYAGIQFEKRIVIDRPGWMHQQWVIKEGE